MKIYISAIFIFAIFYSSLYSEDKPADAEYFIAANVTEIETGKKPMAQRASDKGAKEIMGNDGVPMVLIPAGEFIMGSPGDKGGADERPQHNVYIDAYYIDKYEVTNRQFKKFVNATGYLTDAEKGGGGWVWNGRIWEQKSAAIWRDPNGDGSGISKKINSPVVQISWNDAIAYARHFGKRLPTEAEWEKACGAGPNEKYCYGNNETALGDYAWFEGNSYNRIHPVSEKEPNSFGIYDMHGNVWEWCGDWYNKDYYKISQKDNPRGSNFGTFRVLRGGSWYVNADSCRAAFRIRNTTGNRDNGYGFRCVYSDKF